MIFVFSRECFEFSLVIAAVAEELPYFLTCERRTPFRERNSSAVTLLPLLKNFFFFYGNRLLEAFLNDFFTKTSSSLIFKVEKLLFRDQQLKREFCPILSRKSLLQ